MTHLDEKDLVAIVGLSCRVAGASSPSQLFQSLASSQDAQSEITRFNVGGYYKSSGANSKGLTNVKHAYFLEDDVDRFDNGFFSIAPNEAVAMDPQQRILLELTYEAMESAGISIEKIKGSNTAVFAGLFTSDYGTSLLRDIDTTPTYQSTGTSNSIAANRISYFFDLHGPSMVIDTACSSTLVALHQAVKCLSSNESDTAIVCGANLIINPDMFVHMSELGFLSPRGRCHSFDASGDGYARGEGVLALILKPLSKAITDGDPIRAVIRGSRLNQDGRTNGITLPSRTAQRENMDQLYRSLGISPDDIQYLEAHGTGTAAGDPIEMGAIEDVFMTGTRNHKLLVGSVKSNVGHLEACAALIAIVKTILCMEHGTVTPQMHFNTPNPNINFDLLQVPVEMMQWPDYGNPTRLAAVNSFGFGGTNGHIVLEGATSPKGTTIQAARPYLCKISASNDAGLAKVAQDLIDYVETRNPSLIDISHTLVGRRSTFRKSQFIVTSDPMGLTSQLRGNNGTIEAPILVSCEPSEKRIAFLFTGQGAQWCGMGQQLITSSPMLASIIDDCDAALAALHDGPAWTLKEELMKPAEESNINYSRYSQPACTAVQLMLVTYWINLGVLPSVVIGHSSGEVAASYAAGHLSLRDAIVVAYYRGLIMGSDGNTDKTRTGVKGAMVAVGLTQDECTLYLSMFHGQVSLAAINSPSSCTLSGDEPCIDHIITLCKQSGTFCRKLRVDMAYHSHHMIPLATKYEKALNEAGVSFSPARLELGCEMFSSVHGRMLEARDLTPAYWAENMISTVRFVKALTEATIFSDANAFLELGPHPALKGPSTDTLSHIGKGAGIDYFGSCFRQKQCFESLLASVGSMIVSGWPINLARINAVDQKSYGSIQLQYGQVLTDLPSYPWDHTISHWAESRISRRHRFREHPRHFLLGSRVHYDNPLSMMWRNLLNPIESPYLTILVEKGYLSIPPSALVLMVLEAARQVTQRSDLTPRSVHLRDIHFKKPIDVFTLKNLSQPVETYVHLVPGKLPDNLVFTTYVCVVDTAEVWHETSSGTVLFDNEDLSIPLAMVIPKHNEDFATNLGTYTLHAATSGVEISERGAHGTFEADVDFRELDDPDISLFHWLLDLPCAFMASGGLPAQYYLSGVGNLSFSLEPSGNGYGGFTMCFERLSALKGRADLYLQTGGRARTQATRLQISMIRLQETLAPLESLLFKDIWMPDITLMQTCKTLHIRRVVELVTHKWPMSEIGIAHLLEPNRSRILDFLIGKGDRQRARFRSVTIVPKEDEMDAGDRFKFANDIEDICDVHLLVTSTQHGTICTEHLHPHGFVCALMDDEADRQAIQKSFDVIAIVEGLEGGNWVLARVKEKKRQSSASRPVKVIVPIANGYKSVIEDCGYEIIVLEDLLKSPAQFKARFTHDVDVIVLDCGASSILTQSQGSELLSWIHLVLEKVSHFLWVSQRSSDSPFFDAAGSFVRTIASENPTITTASLMVKFRLDNRSLMSTVTKVFESLLSGAAEVEMEADGKDIFILRYLPDDELSAFVGASSPYRTTRFLSETSYSISPVSPGIVSIYPHRFDSTLASLANPEFIAVDVWFSAVDLLDAAQLWCADPVARSLGQYYVGTATLYGVSTPVVGWCPGAHSSKLFVDLSRVYVIPKDNSAEEALTKFVCYTTALAIVDGTARARCGDTFDIDVSEPYAQALITVCERLGCIVVGRAKRDADFTVRWSSSSGLTLNDKPVSLEDYMLCSVSEKLVDEILRHPCVHTSPGVFGINEYQEAFDAASKTGAISLIHHGACSERFPQVISHKKDTQLLQATGAYIIIGGLGGLGRFLLSWLIQVGARNLFVLSRSGPASELAKETMRSISELGATLEVLQVDASNFDAVNSAMVRIRSAMLIRGCFNMALVLEDSPIMTMEPWQWDMAIRTKIDSTWNMHLATLDDKLDIFIMFSSVASISGNRAQAAYATGNSFLNAMAKYRRRLGLPAISIALGAMSEIGVLAEDHEIQRTLDQSGLRVMTPPELLQVVEAAVYESHRTDRSLLVTGLQMYTSVNGHIKASPNQNQLWWTQSPEFGFLLDHRHSNQAEEKEVKLAEKLRKADLESAEKALTKALLNCVSIVMGYSVERLDPKEALSAYGIDSLNAVAIRFWFYKQCDIDIPVFDILGCKSIKMLVSRVLLKCRVRSTSHESISMPEPVRHKTEDLKVRPLSHSQSRLWFLQHFLSDKTLYNLLLVCHISGTVNVSTFRQAWTVLLQRHEVLRSRIIGTADGWQQLPIPDPEYELVEICTSQATFCSQRERIAHIARNHVFGIERGELVRGWLISSPRESQFFMASHHLAWDRASVPTIFTELTTIYKNIVAGENPVSCLEPSPFQFIDYTLWQAKCLSTRGLMETHIDYWKGQLRDLPDCASLLSLAQVTQRPDVKHNGTCVQPLVIESTLFSAVKSFCAQHAATPFMFMSSVMAALVHRLNGDEDIVIGIADGDRGHTAFDNMVGFTVNMLPIRVRVQKDAPYLDLLEEFRAICLQAYEHRAVPLDYMLQVLDLTRSTSHNPIFQIVVNYQNQGSFPTCDFGEFQFTSYEHFNAITQADLALEIEEAPGGDIHCSFEFDAALYSQTGVQDFSRMFKVLLEAIVLTGGQTPLNCTDIMPQDDYEFVSSILQPFLSTQGIGEDIFPDLFDRAVARTPTKPALVDNLESLSYKELEHATGKVARRLLDLGTNMQDPVGICSEPGVNMVIAIYGVLRAGCTYVPIDADYPPERVASIIEDTDLKVVVTDVLRQPLEEKLIISGILLQDILAVADIRMCGTDSHIFSLPRKITAADTFISIFTSGSTGRPKGVSLTHGQLRYQAEAYHGTIGTSENDTLLLSSAIVFDMSLHSLFGAIYRGATLVVASREERYSPDQMIDLILGHEISNCIFTTTQIKLLLAAPTRHRLRLWKSLRTICCGGEAVPSSIFMGIADLGVEGFALYNAYGPTETTMVNSVKRIINDDTKGVFLPLGPPLPPSRFHILDKHMNPVPIGTPGELYIGGPLVSSGYLKRDDLTAAAFVQDPFATLEDLEVGQLKLYKTGDSFVIEHDGTLKVLGRIGGSRQVKIRGMRTELGEIEAVINDGLGALEELRDCPVSLVAVFYYPADEVSGVLAAYLECGDALLKEPMAQKSLKRHLERSLAATLPAHMVPNVLSMVGSLPRTVGGKLDYKTIQAWPIPRPEVHPSEEADSDIIRLTPTQSTIATIWKHSLKISRNLISTDEFFALGGHSLILIRVREELQHSFHVNISLADLFAYPSLHGLATLIEERMVQNGFSGESHGSSTDERCGQSDVALALADYTAQPHSELQLDKFDPSSRKADNGLYHLSGNGQQHRKGEAIDWASETKLPDDWDWRGLDPSCSTDDSTIGITGACSMIGVHFIFRVLSTTRAVIHCLAIDSPDDLNAWTTVVTLLKQWQLLQLLEVGDLTRIVAHSGRLADPTLGLSSEQFNQLDKELTAIYQLDSEVSLLKRYDDLRAGNVNSLRFLISLAGGNCGNVKPLHYLSTWGVPHLQAWDGTTLDQSGIINTEHNMTRMVPSTDQSLGYLKARWVCEILLCDAAARGIPVSLFRPSMCGGSSASGMPLPRTDINRRILEASLQTGLMPDFGSDRGGGMSWISADFLVASIFHLAKNCLPGRTEPSVFHLVSNRHVSYRDMTEILQVAHDGQTLRTVPPEKWIDALRATNDPEMAMQAEVLAEWWQAGWLPFGLEATETLDRLRTEKGLIPPVVDRAFLLKFVVGEEGF